MRDERTKGQTKFRLPSFMIADHPLPWLLPLIILMLAFAVYPFFYNIYLSLHEFVPRSRSLEFVGLENWELMFSEVRMWNALGVTLFYTFVCLGLELVLGMLIALLMDSDDLGFGFLRGVLTMTLVIPPAITGMMFLLMEDAEFGLITWLLTEAGFIDPAHPILATASTAIWGVIAADVWQWTPFMVLIFTAGLRALPSDPVEAALIDGANAFQIFWQITLPLMWRVIAIAVLIRGIDVFRLFDYVFVMTSGGPGIATYTLSLYAWQQTFSFIKWGYGATISLFSLFIILLIASLFIKFAKVRW